MPEHMESTESTEPTEPKKSQKITHDEAVSDESGIAETTPGAAPSAEASERAEVENGAEQAATRALSPRPRIRWGAVVWGLIVGSLAIITLAIARTEAGRENFALWMARLTPGGIWLIVVLALGGTLLLLGLLSAIRRLQHAR
jgi:hypothetical protein